MIIVRLRRRPADQALTASMPDEWTSIEMFMLREGFPQEAKAEVRRWYVHTSDHTFQVRFGEAAYTWTR